MQAVRNKTSKRVSTRNTRKSDSILIPWHYQGKPVDEIPEGAFGFAYLIEVVDKKGKLIAKYIGKKQFIRTRTRNIGKRELAQLSIKAGRKPKKKKTTGESDWKTYIGSSKEIKQLYQEGTYVFNRIILEYTSTAKQLTYAELKHMIKHEVLENQHIYLNRNILNRFFPQELIPKPVCKVCTYH